MCPRPMGCGKWGKDSLAGLYQLIPNPWTERRLFSQERPSSGPLGLEDLNPPPAKRLREHSPAGRDYLSVIRTSASVLSLQEGLGRFLLLPI